MNSKKTKAVKINLILILTIILIMGAFAFSNYNKFDKGETLLNQLDSEVISSEEKTEEETWESFIEDLSRFGVDAGNVGLDVLRVLFVWIPVIHAVFLLFFSILSWIVFRPTDNRITAYRVLMAFAYFNIIVTIIVLIVGIVIHYSAFKKVKMFIFVLQCLGVLIINFRTTYSYRIKDYNFNKSKDYDKENQVPVVRASICTGEQVAGFKDLHNGKFQEVMLVKNDKDMQKFLKQYDIKEEDVRKEW